jgi:CBS-domain-containing membrane protein
MPRRLRPYVTRHEVRSGNALAHVKSGLGGAVGIGAVGALAVATQQPFLLAPFGASAVLLFGHPASPLAQPANVIGGYFVATLVTLLVVMLFPGAWVAAAVGVGLVIALMSILRVTHPPAGAIPILAVTSTIQGGTLLGVVVGGSIGLVGVAALHHWLPPRLEYPKRPRLEDSTRPPIPESRGQIGGS